MLRFEHHGEPLAHPLVFLRRLGKSFLLSSGIIFGSLLLGVLGYRMLAGLGWLDALLNASMILGGMGQVDPVSSTAGKLFASFYALYSGVVFLVAAGIFVSPAIHRLLHHFHLEKRGPG
jgi:hypothetical protein